eukprot:2611950-Pyramimonas_sp.AAC.1
MCIRDRDTEDPALAEAPQQGHLLSSPARCAGGWALGDRGECRRGPRLGGLRRGARLARARGRRR